MVMKNKVREKQCSLNWTHNYDQICCYSAKVLNDRFIGSFDSTQRNEFSEINGIPSRDELLSSPLVNKFR